MVIPSDFSNTKRKNWSQINNCGPRIHHSPVKPEQFVSETTKASKDRGGKFKVTFLTRSVGANKKFLKIRVLRFKFVKESL